MTYKDLEAKLIKSANTASPEVFTAGLAHEIKNTHAIILKGIELLGKNDSCDVRQYALKFMKDAVIRANRLTQDLLSFSIEPTTQKESIDFQMVLEETLSIISPL